MFGAPCANGTLASFSTCTFTNGTNSWNLTSNGFTAASSFTSNYTTTALSTNEIQVMFNAWGDGFLINYSPLGANSAQKFGASFVSGNAQVDRFEIGFQLTPNNPAAKIADIQSDLNGPAGQIPVLNPGTPGSTNPNIDFLQTVARLGSPTEFQTFTRDTMSITASSGQVVTPLNLSLSSPLTTVLSIVNVFSANGGGNAGGSVLASGYTNYFAPASAPVQSGVSEPMIFAMMGAGLVGLVLLRRRK